MNQPTEVSQRPIRTSKEKPIRTAGTRCMEAIPPRRINCGAARRMKPRIARNQPNREIVTAAGLDQYWWKAIISRPQKNNNAPIIHTSASF